MTATKELLKSHAELQKEYGIALRMWSEARGMYRAGSPEVLSATALLEEVEQKLSAHPVIARPGKRDLHLLANPEAPLNTDEKP